MKWSELTAEQRTEMAQILRSDATALRDAGRVKNDDGAHEVWGAMHDALADAIEASEDVGPPTEIPVALIEVRQRALTRLVPKLPYRAIYTALRSSWGMRRIAADGDTEAEAVRNVLLRVASRKA